MDRRRFAKVIRELERLARRKIAIEGAKARLPLRKRRWFVVDAAHLSSLDGSPRDIAAAVHAVYLEDLSQSS
jgi:hypothetical protein